MGSRRNIKILLNYTPPREMVISINHVCRVEAESNKMRNLLDLISYLNILTIITFSSHLLDNVTFFDFNLNDSIHFDF